MNLILNFFKIIYKIMKVYIVLFIFLILFIFTILPIFLFKSEGEKSFDYVVIDDIKVANNNIENSINFITLKKKLKQISTDKGVKGIIINLDDFDISTGDMMDLFDELELIKQNKDVKIYSTNMTKYTYLKSLIASEIIMPNSSSAIFSLEGYKYSKSYYKKFYDKIGINFEIYRTGNSKSYGEENYLYNISNEEKEYIVNLIDYREKYFYNSLKKYRNKVVKVYENDLKQGDNIHSNAIIAHQKGYVDTLMYYEDLIKDLNIINISNYKLVNKFNSSDNLYVINLYGNIGEKITDDSIYSDVEILNDIMEEGEILLLNINSPGGSAYLSEKIYRILEKLKAEKKIKIYVYSNTVLASGAYYIAQAADKIFTSDLTVVGSVGVVSLSMNVENLLEKLGINTVSIYKNKTADITDITKKTSELEREKYIKNIQYIYNDFKKVVSTSRNIEFNSLEKLAGGKVYNADEAKKINFVDEVMTFNEVVDYIQKEQNKKLNLYIVNESKIDYKEILVEKLKKYILDNYLKEYTYDLKSNILLKEEK